LVGILIPFVAFVIPIIAYAVIFTWVFNNTGGSLGLSILLHASNNTAVGMLPLLFPSLDMLKQEGKDCTNTCGCLSSSPLPNHHN
jgi:membrane protease YdiL (CAAX protease family)